jgi:outer membrane protein TolC
MPQLLPGVIRFSLLTLAMAMAAPLRPLSAQAPASRATPAAATLTLGAVYRQVHAGSPRLAAAAAAAAAAAERIAPARTPPDPRIQFALMNRELPGLARSDPLGMDQVQVMQMLPFPGKLRLAGRVASERAAAQQARTADVAWDVRARAAMAYYEIWEMDRSLILADETLQLLRDLSETANTMYAVGEGRQADVLRAQVELARMDEEITRMRVERASAEARLNALLDQPADVPVAATVLPAFPESLPAVDGLIAEAEARRPMIQAGEGELRAAEAAARLARREIWPDLELGIQYGQRPMAEGTDRMISVMLGMSVPVFAGRRQLPMRREAEAMRLMAASDLAEMRAATRGRVAELYAAVQRSRRLGELYRGTILPQSQAAVASALSSYRVGGIDFMTLLDNQMTVNRYRQDLYALNAEQGRALAELEMLLGRELLDPDLPAAGDLAR